MHTGNPEVKWDDWYCFQHRLYSSLALQPTRRGFSVVKASQDFRSANGCQKKRLIGNRKGEITQRALLALHRYEDTGVNQLRHGGAPILG